MFKAFAARATVTSSILLLFGVGCGSTGGGGGCGGLKPLPSANGNRARPLGIAERSSDRRRPAGAHHQAGHGQAHRRGGQPRLGRSQGRHLHPADRYGLRQRLLNAATVGACDNGTCGGAQGCSASLVLTSADGKDKITAGIGEGDNPVVHLDAKFDVHVPLDFDYDARASVHQRQRLVHDGHRVAALQRRVAESARDHRRHPDRNRSGDGRADAQPRQHRARSTSASTSTAAACSARSSIGSSALLNTTIGNVLTNLVLNLSSRRSTRSCSRSCRSRRASPACSTPARCSPASIAPKDARPRDVRRRRRLRRGQGRRPQPRRHVGHEQRPRRDDAHARA